MPMYDIVIDLPFTFSKVKFPSKSVTTPFCVPVSMTVAPMMVSPLESVTVPLIVCAEMLPAIIARANNSANLKNFNLPNIDFILGLKKYGR